jgi:ribosomal protein S18 acetylase RimI-like enzyme
MHSIREGSLSILPTEENADKGVKIAQSGLSTGRDLLLVTKTRNRIVGHAFANVSQESLFERSEPFCFLNDVYVVPEFRRSGIGRRLISEYLNRMKARGFKSVRLNVLPENSIAIRLYEKFGFKTFMYGMKRALAHAHGKRTCMHRPKKEPTAAQLPQ